MDGAKELCCAALGCNHVALLVTSVHDGDGELMAACSPECGERIEALAYVLRLMRLTRDARREAFRCLSTDSLRDLRADLAAERRA